MKTNHSEPASPPSRAEVWRMFDRIAPRYDLLNHLLSLRQDLYWRRQLVQRVGHCNPRQVLDIATGTADVLLALCQAYPALDQALGVDLAEAMLAIGRRKVQQQGFAGKIALQAGDALALPVPAESFDAVTIAFGIRNVLQVEKALGEMGRVLRPGGKAFILEFSLPASPWLRPLYLLYLRHVLPRLGSLVSGDGQAYRYLNRTIETFPYGPAFCQLMEEAGFSQIQARPMTLGVVTLYQGTRPC